MSVSESEAFLHALAERTFLKLWTVPTAYRAPGKELSDLVVVFGDDVVIFSDKACQLSLTSHVATGWDRWRREAVDGSVKRRVHRRAAGGEPQARAGLHAARRRGVRQLDFLKLLSGEAAAEPRRGDAGPPRLTLVVTTPVADADTPVVAPSGLPAPHGIGAWGGRRLLYRGDAELEMLANGDLHVVLLDLLVSVARSRADLGGRAVDRRGDVARAAKVAAMAAEKAAVVARTAADVAQALREMANATPPVPAGFSDVAEWLVDCGKGVHRSTLYRRPEYANPILLAMGREPRDDAAIEAAADPEYARVARLTKPELIEEIRRARRALKAAEGELARSLVGIVA